jgi:group I intron endonuclease
MRKDIYIIKNKINNKVYIGQAIDSHKRFISHCSRAKRNIDNSPIHDAINKYGKENFYYEIIESQISNYNDRENIGLVIIIV